jgi:hypothetical protein
VSVPLVLQVLGWVTVVWLVTIYLLIGRGRLPHGGAAARIAGGAAAASVIAASLAANLWPVAALGLLWLRIEVFAHRHPTGQDQVPLKPPDTRPATAGAWAGLRRFGPRALDVLFKVEIAAVIVAALILFGFWAEQQRATFDHRTNTKLCDLMGGC